MPRRETATTIDMARLKASAAAYLRGFLKGPCVDVGRSHLGAEMEMDGLEPDPSKEQTADDVAGFRGGESELRGQFWGFRVKFFARLESHTANPAHSFGERGQRRDFAGGVEVHAEAWHWMSR